MSRKPSVKQVQNFNEDVRQRTGELRQQLRDAITSMGGNNPAPTASLPKLERDFNRLYNYAQDKVDRTSALSRNRENKDAYATVQANADLHRALKNRRTEEKLESIGQKNMTPVVAQPTIMGMGNGLYGRLTPEMQNAGLSLEDVERYNERVNREQTERATRETAEKHPVLSTAGSFLINPINAIGNNARNVSNYLQGKPIQNETNYAHLIRETVGEGIKTKPGKFAYNVANSAGDMLTAMLMGGAAPLSAGLMGLEKSNEVMNSAVDRGLTPNQIMLEGIGSGATTALTEAIPMGKIAEGGHIAGAAISEGLQEGAEDIADTILDEIVTRVGGNPDKSELSNNVAMYLEAGYSPDEAKNAVFWDYLKQTGLDMAAGAVTGGTLGAARNVLSGNNAITGKPKIPALNQQTETSNTDVNTLPSVQAETEANRQYSEDMARLNEELANRRAEEEARQNEENVKPVEQTQSIPTLDRQKVGADENETAFPTNEEYYRQWAAEGLLGPNVTPENVTRQDVINANMYEEPNAREDLINAFVKLGYDYFGGQELNDNYTDKDTLFELDTNWDLSHDFLARGEFSPEAFAQAFDEAVKTNPNATVESVVRRAYEIDGKTPNENMIGGGGNTQAASPVITNYIARATQQTKANESAISSETQEQHTPEQERIIQEYKNSSDEEVAAWIKARRNGEYTKPVTVGKVTDEVAEFINNELGINTYGNEVVMNNSSFTHINNEHMGNKNKSPMTDEDLSRIGYVLENPDEIAKTGKVSTATSLKDGSPAPKFILRKRIDGHYYVVEAATDAKTKKNVVVTAFIEQVGKEKENIKKLFKESYHVPNALAEASPSANARSVHELDSSVKSVPQTEENVNSIPQLEKPTQQVSEQQINDAKTDAEVEELAGNVADELDNNLQFFAEDEPRVINYRDPGYQSGRYNESKFYQTGKDRGMSEGEQIEHDYREDMMYQEIGDEESMNAAYDNINKNGRKKEFDDLYKKTGWNKVDIDEAMILWSEINDEIAEAERLGIDAEYLYEQSADFFDKIQSEVTANAQAIQALAKWAAVRKNGELTPQAMLAAAVRVATQMTKRTNSEANQSADTRETEDVVRKFKFSKDFTKAFLKEAKEFVKNKNNMTLREQQVGYAKLAKTLMAEIPRSWASKFKSVLMDNMLMSIRTLISRNMLGNAGLASVDQTITKFFAGLIDRSVARGATGKVLSALGADITGDRTTTGLTTEGLKRYGKGFVEGLKQTTADYFKDDVNTARAGENSFEELIKNNGRLWNEKVDNKALKAMAKAGNVLDRLVSFGLTVGDNPFYKANFEQSMYEYDKLRSEGNFSKLSDAEFEKFKTAYSVYNALQAVYQNDTELAQGFNDLKNALGKISKDTIGIDVLTQASMPFVKTPANVFRTQIEYSPFGIAKNIVNTLVEINADIRRGKGKEVGDLTFNQRRFVRETSRNIVGTMLYALAIGLAKSGAISGAFSDDDDMKQAQRQAGMQEYALKVGDNYHQISYLPVIGSAGVAGAATWDAIQKNGGEITPENIMNGLRAGVSSQLENSMMQGAQKLFGTQSAYSSGGFVENATNTIKSAGSQLIPSILRQAVTASDKYQRDTYGKGDDEKYLMNIQAGLPFLRQQLQPRIGMTGEKLEQNAGRNVAQKWWDNLVNPAIVTSTTANPDPVRDEAMRLYDTLDDKKLARDAFEQRVGYSDITTDEHEPTAEEFTRYQQQVYGQMNETARELINSDYYQSLSDEDKVKMLDNVYDTVRNVVRGEFTDKDIDDLNTAEKIYADEGMDGYLDYLTASSVFNQMGCSYDDKYRDDVLKTINKLDADEIAEMVENYNDNFDTSVRQINRQLPDSVTRGLSEDDKKQLDKDINAAVRANEMRDMFGLDKSDLTGAAAAYRNGGVEGATDYLYARAVCNQMGVQNSEKNRNEILDAYHSGGESAVQNYISGRQADAEEAQRLEDAGLNTNMQHKYHHAQGAIPSLTPTQFTDTWNAMNTDNNTSIKIDEVIDYLNRDPQKYNDQSAQQVWNAYYSGTSQKIPVLDPKTGQWKAQ
jgi:hypothetical protein